MTNRYCGNCGAFMPSDAPEPGDEPGDLQMVLTEEHTLVGGTNVLTTRRRLCSECVHRFGEQMLHNRPLLVNMPDKNEPEHGA